MHATARAPSNIALVKYWGKRDARLNVPATGSISVTLRGLETVTRVAFDPALERDEIRIAGVEDPAGEERVVRFLDLVRGRFGPAHHARVESRNSFPTGAGLASSASAFAALAVACDAALGLGLSREQLSALARRGSGSAARSLIDGFAEMRAGEAPDGSDSFAVPLGAPDLLPLAILVVVTTRERKPTSSTEGMVRTQETSPFYGAWRERTVRDLQEMRAALRARDLGAVGRLAEGNALRMHALMLSADPPLLYWNPATVAVLREVEAARRDGLAAWCTIDAGPQVKVLCAGPDSDVLHARLAEVQGVQEILRSGPGLGARLVEADT